MDPQISSMKLRTTCTSPWLLHREKQRRRSHQALQRMTVLFQLYNSLLDMRLKLLHLDSYNFCPELRPVVASLSGRRTVYTYHFGTPDLTA